MPEGSKKKSGQAESDKKTTAKVATAEKAVKKAAETKAAEPKKETKVVKEVKEVKEAANKEAVKKEEAVKADVKKEDTKKETVVVVKESVQKAPKKDTAKAKKASKEPVVPEVVLQYDDNGTQEANLADITAKIKAAYVAEGHRESSIKSLSIYLKPQEWKAYYVINGKIEGNIELF